MTDDAINVTKSESRRSAVFVVQWNRQVIVFSLLLRSYRELVDCFCVCVCVSIEKEKKKKNERIDSFLRAHFLYRRRRRRHHRHLQTEKNERRRDQQPECFDSSETKRDR